MYPRLASRANPLPLYIALPPSQVSAVKMREADMHGVFRSMDAINSYTKSICYCTHKNCPSSETDPFIECMIIVKYYCEL